MNQKLMLDLWHERIKRIIKLEVESRNSYKVLLRDYAHLLAGSRIRKHLKNILRDEENHIHIAKRIQQIIKEKLAKD